MLWRLGGSEMSVMIVVRKKKCGCQQYVHLTNPESSEGTERDLRDSGLSHTSTERQR